MKRTAFFLVFLLLVGCNPPQTEQDSQPLRVGTRRAPDSLHPYVTTTYEGEVIAARLYPTLFRELPIIKQGVPQLEPVLVDSYEILDGGREIQITLKDGLVWSDGKPLKVNDVIYSFSVQIDHQVGWFSRDRKQHIQSIEAVGENTLSARFKRQSPFNLLDLNEGFIIPEHFFGPIPVGDWKRAWGEDLVVFGPYKPTGTSDGERLVLRSLREGVPDLGFAFVRERETLYQLLISGDLDYAWPLPADRLVDIEENLQSALYNEMGFSFLGFNPIDPAAIKDADVNSFLDLKNLKEQSPHPIFGDTRVRRAIAHSVDRARHAKHFLGKWGSVPINPWQMGINSSSSNRSAERFDVDLAGRLLEEAGWKLEGDLRVRDGKPLQFTVICNISKGIREQYLLAVQQDLRAVGIIMDIDLQEAARYSQNCMERNFDAMYGAYRISSRPDHADMFHSSAMLNFTSWIEADEALEKVRDAPTVADVVSNVSALEDLFHEQMPFLILFSRTMIAASGKDLKTQGNYLDPLYEVDVWKRQSR